MEIKAKKLNGANASASAKISNETIKNKEEKILKVMSRNANIAGFRKGKVPTSILKERHAERVRADAEQEAVKELYESAIKELEFDEKNIIGEPIFTKFEKLADGGLEVELKLSYKPAISLDGFEECIPDFKAPSATKNETEERIKNLLKMSAPLKKIETKRGLKNGDFALIDFEGFIDDVAFDGGKAENYTLEIGSNSFIEGFEKGLVGLKAGGSRDVEATFPENYGKSDLAGKKAVFKVKLHEIKEKDVQEDISEEMLKTMLPKEKKPTREMLEEKIKEQIKSEKLAKLYHEDLKPKFVEAIIKKFSFDLPDNIVEQEIDVLFRNSFINIKPEEIEEFKKDAEKAKQKRETFRKDAEDSVKLTFMVNELAILNDISVSDQEVTQMIYMEAVQYGQDPKVHFENYKKQGVLPAVKMAMVEDRLFQTLFDKQANKGK